MSRQLLEHMIQKANTRAYVVCAGPVEIDRCLDLGFLGFPIYGRGSRHAFMLRSVYRIGGLAGCDVDRKTSTGVFLRALPLVFPRKRSEILAI